ncbi:DUF1365 domain-containing protein [Streptomyces sp. NPDC047117]|uniref:DUF1365 domain-containing protein n=1 Tax=unclassified Streptomyces TaxID=2593676 RepID=UPI0033F5D364
MYPSLITHVRTRPRRYAFRQRTYLWLVDLDALPRLPRILRPLARFEARDHFAGGSRKDAKDAKDARYTIRDGLEAFLAARGVELRGGPVLMLAHARVFGHVFNPLSVYWCHTPDGALRCVVAEVHNTYGQRHCYLLEPRTAEQGSRTDKEFYVSPFFGVDGAYRMRLPVPGERLDLSVRLEIEGSHLLTATVRGVRRPAGTADLLRAAARHPWSTAAVSLGIRFHGIRLWRRGLPVQPCPPHDLQEGMQ